MRKLIVVLIVWNLEFSSSRFVQLNDLSKIVISDNECEIVDVPNFQNKTSIYWTLKVFNYSINLNLELNQDFFQKINNNNNNNYCQYSHHDGNVTAGVSYCNKSMVIFFII